MKPLCLIPAVALALALPARAANVDEALQHATEFLLGQQDATGAIWEIEDPKVHLQTAMSSLSILALSSLGHGPGDATREGEALRKALNFVLQPDNQTPEGYFGLKDGSRMYGHGITTLMLAEMLGMGADASQDELIRTRCRHGVELILRAQKIPKNDLNKGGWRYTPDAGDSDMSVTVWQTMALRAAKNAGLDVPKDAIDEAVAYIRRCYEPPPERQETLGGGFGYLARGHEVSTTAEGMLALQVCGQYELPEVKAAGDRLLKEGLKPGEQWFFYTGYYYAQAMNQRGGVYATEGRRVVADVIVPLQAKDGSWQSTNGGEKDAKKVYATSMAILSLAVKNHFLPIYQR